MDEASESPTEDLLERPAPGHLLHLRDTKDTASHGRAAAAQGNQAARARMPVSFAQPHTGPDETLEARQEHVSQATIETQWDKLDTSSQQAIQALLAGVHVPVLSNFNSERSKGEAQVFLQDLRSS